VVPCFVVLDHITVRAVFHGRRGPYRGAGTGREGGRIPPDKKPIGTVPGLRYYLLKCGCTPFRLWKPAVMSREGLVVGEGGRREGFFENLLM
jgi:hypothetical protein